MADQPNVNRTDERNIPRSVGITPIPDDASENASYVLAYTDDNLTTVTKTMNGIAYERTLSWTGSNLTGVTVWSEV